MRKRYQASICDSNPQPIWPTPSTMSLRSGTRPGVRVGTVPPAVSAPIEPTWLSPGGMSFASGPTPGSPGSGRWWRSLGLHGSPVRATRWPMSLLVWLSWPAGQAVPLVSWLGHVSAPCPPMLEVTMPMWMS